MHLIYLTVPKLLAMLNSFMATNPSLPTRPIHETSISITTLSDKRD